MSRVATDGTSRVEIDVQSHKPTTGFSDVHRHCVTDPRPKKSDGDHRDRQYYTAISFGNDCGFIHGFFPVDFVSNLVLVQEIFVTLAGNFRFDCLGEI